MCTHKIDREEISKAVRSLMEEKEGKEISKTGELLKIVDVNVIKKKMDNLQRLCQNWLRVSKAFSISFLILMVVLWFPVPLI